jgi:peptidylprolyl isomerase
MGWRTTFNTVLRQAMLVVMVLLLAASPGVAALPRGNAVTDPAALLRNALPIEQPGLQELQHRLEDTSDDLRAKRWSALDAAVRRSQSMLASRRESILASFQPADKDAATDLLSALEQQLQKLDTTAAAQDREAFVDARHEALASIGAAEALLVGPFPFEIPSQFDGLPRLLGRATVLLTTTKGDLTAVVDGYNAPLTAGAFVDLVQRRFYDGLPFSRAEDFYVLQTGDPEGPAEGFIDPATKTERRVPL